MNSQDRRQPRRRDEFPVTSCDCAACRAACLNSPGWFTPDQIEPLARHLDLGVEETFARYLAVGVTKLADGSLHHGIMPHKLRDGKKPGSVWTLPELAQPGRCVFFDRGRCRIYPVRPYECARMLHDRHREAIRLRRRILTHWTAAALKPFAQLAGHRLFSGPARRRGAR
ncbi:MAG TPA: YkgJ family cysteine cluster protein [Candidatus Krumholzibacteria bacterium]|nr:YkgJ family cysteine cluster protein [Candidatus Krumholzibacteria bacterium]HPD72488.1 YkgJ family cysteine cluster protein [Candidatus Krumholzibacteria bacterium]HRY40580.1 YkgJ family cysteine cluster protein [Candidatus Krumholzibacteria bacterium]